MALYLGWPYPAQAIAIEKSSSEPGKKYLVYNHAVGMPRGWSRHHLPEPALYPRSTRPLRSSTAHQHGAHQRSPLIQRRWTNHQLYHHPVHQQAAAMELPLARTGQPHSQGQPSFRAVAIRLDRTLRHAISFFTILNNNFGTETRGLRSYATPSTLAELWRSKLVQSNRHPQSVNPNQDSIHPSNNANQDQGFELHTFETIRRDLKDHCEAFCHAVITDPGNPAFVEPDRPTISGHAVDMTDQQRQDAHTLQRTISPRVPVLLHHLTEVKTCYETLRSMLLELKVLNDTLQIYQLVWTEKVDGNAANRDGDQAQDWKG